MLMCMLLRVCILHAPDAKVVSTCRVCIQLDSLTLNIDNSVLGGVWEPPWQHRGVGHDRQSEADK